MTEKHLTDEAGQHLTFSMGTETFALEIDRAREVVDDTEVTEVPGMPACLPGVFNLRGGIVSVVDLRRMLGVAADERKEGGCVIILEIEMDGELVTIGTLADEVRGVVCFGRESILPPPEIGMNINKEYIRGVGKRDDEFVFIIDIEKVVLRIEAETLATQGNDSTGTDG